MLNQSTGQGLMTRPAPTLPTEEGGEAGGGGGGGVGGGGGGLMVGQPNCHISSSRSCPAPSWLPGPGCPSGLQENSGLQNSLTSSYSINQRLSNQLSVDSGGSLNLGPTLSHRSPPAPPAYSERPGGDRAGLSAPSFTSHSNHS